MQQKATKRSHKKGKKHISQVVKIRKTSGQASAVNMTQIRQYSLESGASRAVLTDMGCIDDLGMLPLCFLYYYFKKYQCHKSNVRDACVTCHLRFKPFSSCYMSIKGNTKSPCRF